MYPSRGLRNHSIPWRDRVACLVWPLLLLVTPAPARAHAPASERWSAQPTPSPAQPSRPTSQPARALAQAKGAQNLLAASSRPRTSTPLARSTIEAQAPIQIRIGPYLGWERCLSLSNGKVEAVVVPAIGRVMQFRFVGKPSPFWEDPSLRGKSPTPTSSEWDNFGGDKTWPAPQSEWERIASRAWPPPPTFDAVTNDVSVWRDAVVLRSPVDPHYGIRTERIIRLEREAPVMSIITTYQKESGPPVKVGVWIITQLDDPVATFARLPEPSRFPDGYNRQSGENLPAGLAVDGRLLSLTRDRQRATKIGTDAEALLWVGPDQMLRIESPRLPDATYPDQQSNAEIYTNPDPKTYVELETLGPLHTLSPGNRISQTNTYTLMPRSHPDPKVDARRALFPPPNPESASKPSQ